MWFVHTPLHTPGHSQRGRFLTPPPLTGFAGVASCPPVLLSSPSSVWSSSVTSLHRLQSEISAHTQFERSVWHAVGLASWSPASWLLSVSLSVVAKLLLQSVQSESSTQMQFVISLVCVVVCEALQSIPLVAWFPLTLFALVLIRSPGVWGVLLRGTLSGSGGRLLQAGPLLLSGPPGAPPVGLFTL